jgi:SOS-response transcriptional repressor LexA
LSPSQIRTMRRQWREGKQRGVSARTVVSLAEALQTTPEWLISGTGPEEVIAEAQPGPAGTAGLRLVGAVGAGLWLEAASENNDALPIAVPPDPRYPADYQTAYKVYGMSTDRFARPGDYLIVVDRAATGLPVRSGDIVIVTRKRDGLREVTARRFQGTAPSCELRFESTDPRYGSPILIRDPDQADLTLGGIVVGVYRPLV